MASEEYTRIAKWLYKSRRSVQPALTQEAVANIAGTSVKTYARWERGISAPDIHQINRIKEHFGWELTRNC